MEQTAFLPVSREEMIARDWWWYDFLLVSGDAYVDHPTFGTAVIGRILEDAGYRVAVLAQPPWRDASAFSAMGRPRLGVMIGAGNLDSMVAHYTAAKKRRSQDFYSPGRRTGLRPDRAVNVYTRLAREAFGPDMPIVIGSLEASLRRFAHYDYWDDAVRPAILFDSGADLLVYGMGERATLEIARRLKNKQPVSSMTDIPGTAWAADAAPDGAIVLPPFEQVRVSRRAYAEAARIEHTEHDPIRGHILAQLHGARYLVVNPPAMPLQTAELDHVAELPYTREVHPMYEAMGGVPAIEEVRFSVTHNRGCFGGCAFCALAFHQGRMVTCRSHESVVREVEAMTRHPLWKGYVSDVGGPTANFRQPSCQKQLKCGMCAHRRCLTPEPCPMLDADHSDYTALLRRVRAIPGVKKAFVRSGIRFDYLLCDRSGEFFDELVEHHISGQLRVAPEHCVDRVLDLMGKPRAAVYERFAARYDKLNRQLGLRQYAVPYLMSSHPGCTLADAAALAEYLNRRGMHPEQVQDFYPTPGTLSTCMYHTGLDPMTMQPVYSAKTPREKAMQRALLQWRLPQNRSLVLAALHEAGRDDLIGFGRDCLVRPNRARRAAPEQGAAAAKQPAAGPKDRPESKPRPGRDKGSSAGPNARAEEARPGGTVRAVPRSRTSDPEPKKTRTARRGKSNGRR